MTNNTFLNRYGRLLQYLKRVFYYELSNLQIKFEPKKKQIYLIYMINKLI